MLDALGYKDVLGALSVLVALVAYGIYGWQTVTGPKRPHPLSWSIFAIVTATGFLVQSDQGAGAGSWVMGVTAAICFLLCLLSVWRGERRFPWYDWAFLFAACLVFLFYVCSKKPHLVTALITSTVTILGYHRSGSSALVAASVEFLNNYGAATSAVLATVVDVLGYGPTVTKAWSRPQTDSILSFTLNSIKFIPSLFAMDTISIATCVYPATLVVVNAGVAILLSWRGRRLRRGVDAASYPRTWDSAPAEAPDEATVRLRVLAK